MKLLIFGSTGGTGRELVKQALDQGHSVMAYARNPDKIGNIQHSSLKIIYGDVLDPDAVEGAVAGQEAIFITIGAGAKRTTLREEGTRRKTSDLSILAWRGRFSSQPAVLYQIHNRSGIPAKCFRRPRTSGSCCETKLVGLDYSSPSSSQGQPANGSISARLSHDGYTNQRLDLTCRCSRLHVKAAC